MRVLLLLAIIYIGYRYFKSWMASYAETRQAGFGKSVQKVDDIMIKDPFCGAYFPKRDGIHGRFDGKDLFFCSKECREKYRITHEKA